MEETPKLTLKHAGLDSKPQWLLSLSCHGHHTSLIRVTFGLLVQFLISSLQPQPNTQTQHLQSEGTSLSRIRLFAIPWTVVYQASLSIGFSRQEYWSGLPFPSPGDPPDPGIEPRSPALQADALPSEPPGKSSHTPEYYFDFKKGY